MLRRTYSEDRGRSSSGRQDVVRSRLELVLLVPRLAMFALGFLRLDRRDLLLLRFGYHLAAAAATHPDVIQHPSGRAGAVAGKRGELIPVLFPVVFLVPSLLMLFLALPVVVPIVLLL